MSFKVTSFKLEEIRFKIQSFFKSTMIGKFLIAIAALTYTVSHNFPFFSVSLISAPNPSWMCPKMCNRQFSNDEIRVARASQPACFSLFVMSKIP